jgi:hypothetical protein
MMTAALSANPPSGGWTTDDGLVVQTYELDREHHVYQPSGTFKDVIEVEQPWRIEIPIDGLRPRNM